MASSRELRVRVHRIDYTNALFEDDQDEEPKKRDTTQWALKLFSDFCTEVGISVEVASNDVQSLAHALMRLYTGARTKKHQLYQMSAFRALRYSLKKHFRETLKVDIVKDEAFAEANKAFTAMENRIEAEVVSKRQIPTVQEKDLELLKEYFENNMKNPTPEQLLEYIWFILQYYKRLLGPGCYDNLTMTRFIIRTDAEGKKCILPNEFLSSNGKGGSNAGFSGSLIPAMKGDVLCPVTAFELYKSKIHKDFDKLFQKPKKYVDPQQEFWFDRISFSKASLKEMMTTLSQNANLSMKYANQSLTGAGIAKLIWGENLVEDAAPPNPEPSNCEEKTKMIRQVKMKSPLSITIVKKKRGRPQKSQIASVTESDNKNSFAELLNQEKSPLKPDNSVANLPPPVTKNSQQQGVKLPPNKSAPSVYSVNKAPCATAPPRAPIAAPCHRQVLPPPKQPLSKSGTGYYSVSNNKQSEMLTSNRTDLFSMHQSIKINEKSTVIGQNVGQSKPGELLPGGYKQAPSSLKSQNVGKNRTGEILRGGYKETPFPVKRPNVWASRTAEVLRGGYKETPPSINAQNVRQSRTVEILRGGYKETPVTGKNVWTPRTDEVVPGGYQETPSSVNVQNVRQSRPDDVVFVDEYREPSSRSTFMITDVRSCGSLFADRNVAKTIVKPVETPTHSYVIHNHQSSMLANMAELWKKGKFCDATIGNGTMKIMVHKIVLLALSPQLLSLANSDLTSGFFQLTFPQEIGGDALWAFSKYMYEGVVSLNSGVLEDMERISSILNLQDLKDMCNLYRNQVNLPNNNSLSSQSLATNNLTSTDDTPINLDPLPASMKLDSSASGTPFFSLPSVTQTVSRPVQRLQIMEPESNSPRLEYSSNQSSIGGVNRVIDDRSCVTISGSDSDSDLTVVSSNIKQNPVRKRRRRHMENNFLQSRQPESFLNDNIHESWPPHSYNGNDNLTNPSQSKQMKLSDNLVIDNSQNFKISYTGANQRSNELPYSLIENLDER